MNTYVVVGIFGIISNFVASLADVPLVKPGKSGPGEGVAVSGVNRWWADVTPNRFILSSWLSFLGQPGAYVVMWFLADLISKNSGSLALALKINTLIGCFTGLICHVYYCMKPLLYQKLNKKMSDDDCVEVIKAIDPVVMAPMVLGGVSLWLGAVIIVAIVIVTGALAVPKLCLLLNPVVAALVLMPLKKCGVKIIGVLGVGYMLFSILLIIAGM